MRLVSLDICHSGVKLGKPIYNENGKVLVSQGIELTDKLIENLKKYHVSTIYIEDELSEGIEIINSIPDQLRVEAIHVITEGFKDILDLNTKKSNLQGMIKSGRAVRSFQKIFNDLYSCLNQNQHALNLLATTKMHEHNVYTHSLNVSIYACQLAIENGLPLKNIEEIGLGALLHDIGKMNIPTSILNKPGKLSEDEYELIKTHCEAGFETLRKIHEIPVPVSHCALQHHERIDGLGYPRGLTDDYIHKYAKILSVADVFDAVTSPRVYRPAMLPHKGLELLYAGSGTQFEDKQVKLFANCIAIYPQGLTVKLNDNRTGIVSSYNFNSAGRPHIRIIRDEENQEVTPYEINLAEYGNLTVEIIEADTLL